MDPRRLDHAPHATSQPSPAYPVDARARGETGTVVVEFLVDRSGTVRDPVVIRSSDPVFEEPALRGVEHWRFEPGRVDGKLVSFRMAVPVQFSLDAN
jgi:protein TonB